MLGFRVYMGRCQNYGPFLGTLNTKCRIIIGTQKGTIILTTAHMDRGPQNSSSGTEHLSKIPSEEGMTALKS